MAPWLRPATMNCMKSVNLGPSSPALLREPVLAVLHLKHAKRLRGQAKMVGRRIGVDAGHTREFLKRLDGIPDLLLVGRSRLLQSGNRDHQRVIGVASKI